VAVVCQVVCAETKLQFVIDYLLPALPLAASNRLMLSASASRDTEYMFRACKQHFV
jgi:hypothetical protein